MAERPCWADRTAMALPMTGQRFANSCSRDMDPPPPQCGEDATWGRALVERALRVAGDDFFMKGHTALDCRRTESMANVSARRSVLRWWVMCARVRWLKVRVSKGFEGGG